MCDKAKIAEELIKGRRSVRKFIGGVERADMDKIIEAGRQAPSAGGAENWRLYRMHGAERATELGRKLYAEVGPKFEFLKVRMDSLGVKEPIFYDSQDVVFVCSVKGKFDLFDDVNIGLCVENMLLMAYALGYASVVVGLAKFGEPIVREEIKFREDEKFHLAVVFGKPDPAVVAELKPKELLETVTEV